MTLVIEFSDDSWICVEAFVLFQISCRSKGVDVVLMAWGNNQSILTGQNLSEMISIDLFCFQFGTYIFLCIPNCPFNGQ